MTSEFYAWQIQLVLSLLFAAHLARIAQRKGRHPFAAALLMLTFANGWPLVYAAIGRGIASVWGMNDTARSVFVRVFGYGGVMFGVAVSYAIVGCLRPTGRRSSVADVPQPRDRDHVRPE